MTTDNATIERGNGHNKSKLKGVVQSFGRSSLPKEFMTIGADFDEALGRCVLRDDVQRNAVNAYKMQLDMFGMDTEKGHLVSWLNSSQAVDGLNRRQTLQAHVGIVLEEGKPQKHFMGIGKQKETARKEGQPSGRVENEEQ